RLRAAARPVAGRPAGALSAESEPPRRRPLDMPSTPCHDMRLLSIFGAIAATSALATETPGTYQLKYFDIRGVAEILECYSL
ncbi:hypothetical protein THAOC_24637, partial [Thalassiosira oceanica]